MIYCLLFSVSAYAQDSFLSVEEAFSQAQTSFSELSSISRNVTMKLEEATKAKDLEKIQCISSRQLSIVTLLDFSKRSMDSLKQSSLSPLMAETELEKLKVALKSANQYKNEVESCLSSAAAQNTAASSTLNFIFDDSKILSNVTIDEAEYGISNIQNSVSNMESNTNSSSNSGELESDTSAPPPASSPYQ